MLAEEEDEEDEERRDDDEEGRKADEDKRMSRGRKQKREKMKRMPRKTGQRKVKEAKKRTNAIVKSMTSDDDLDAIFMEQLAEGGMEPEGLAGKFNLVRARKSMNQEDCQGRGGAFPLRMAAMPKQSGPPPQLKHPDTSDEETGEEEMKVADGETGNSGKVIDDESDNSGDGRLNIDDTEIPDNSSIPGWSSPPLPHADRHPRVPVSAGPSTGPGLQKDLNAFELRYRSSPIDNVDAVDNVWKALPGGITIDSGAAESVMPLEACKNYPVEEGPQKRMGVFYVAANGEELDNEGERRIAFATEHGGSRSMTFQVTNVNKVLGSVSHLCAMGQQVVFNPRHHPDGSYIRDLTTETITPLRQENGVYKLDAWVRPYGGGADSVFAGREQ